MGVVTALHAGDLAYPWKPALAALASSAPKLQYYPSSKLDALLRGLGSASMDSERGTDALPTDCDALWDV